jgi:hypothetical protein
MAARSPSAICRSRGSSANSLFVNLQDHLWPIAATLLGFWGIYWLKEPLGRLIDRIAIKYERKGLQASTVPQEIHGSQPYLSVAASFFDPNLLKLYRDEIEQELHKNKLPAGPTRENELLDLCAGVWIISFFERAYLTIFGSQLAAMQALNSGGPEGFPLATIRPFYDLGASNFPSVYENYTFEQWLGYLESSQLVARLPGDRITISINGRAFLKYLVHQGYALLKDN